MSHVEMPANVLADSLWLLGDEVTPENRSQWIKVMRECWTDEMAAMWWPALIMDMDEWLDDHSMVETVRDFCLAEWEHLNTKAPYAFCLGSQPFKVAKGAPTFSVMVKNVDPSIATADILFAMSAVTDGGSITRLHRPTFPNGKFKRFVVVDYTLKAYMDAALCWSERITLGGNILTIEECVPQKKK